METCSNKIYKVVILGAGISGLAAANFLYSRGIHEILVLEAKSKAGGRIHTAHFEDSLESVELGAGWIHGEENDFFKLVKKFGHLHPKTSWEGRGDFLCPDGTKVEGSIVSEVMDWLDNTIGYIEDTFCIEELHTCPSQYAKPTFSSMGKFLKKRFSKYLVNTGVIKGSEEYNLKTSIFQWGMSFQRIDNSCNQMSELSLFRWSEFQVNGGELYNNFKYGASAFVENVLVGQLPSHVINCNCPVENINWEDKDCAKITLRNGKLIKAQTVIVTFSIGVLKSKMENLFTPNLPSGLQRAINATGFGPIGKIYLKWDTPWWPQGMEGFQFLWCKEFINCCDDDQQQILGDEELSQRWPKSITGFDPILDSSNILCGWLGGPEAEFVETMNEKEVGKVCAQLLRKFTGHQVPEPCAVLVSKWCSDEFVRGAYCHRGTEGDKVHGDIAALLSRPVLQKDCIKGHEKPVILLAGEALSKTHYSTLHGAYETGESQAAKLLDYFQKSEQISNTIQLPNGSNTKIVEEMDISHNQLNSQSELQLSCQFSQKVNIN